MNAQRIAPPGLDITATEWPREPQTVEETGLDFGLILDLCLKTIYYAGRPAARIIVERSGLPFAVIEDVLIFLRKQELVEIVGTSGHSELDYQYGLTSKGIDKTREALEKSTYVGQAPVPFDVYVDVVQRQTVKGMEIPPVRIEAALSNLVLHELTVQQIGTAVSSGKSIFLYGEPGNGKSTIAEAIGAMLPGAIVVPYAVEIYGQIVRVFDPRVHLRPDRTPEQVDPIEELTGFGGILESPGRGADMRWALSRRPIVLAGGELTMEELELRFSPSSRFYIAPLQLKANNGVLVLDDFGRQRLRPEELLNRWMVPMESQVDHLVLQTGETFEVPFDVLLVFATNITPSRLGDEAFFRRIRHKIRISDPDEGEFRRILERMSSRADIAYDDSVTNYLVDTYYREAGRPFRGVHPRDLFELILDEARYLSLRPTYSRDRIDLACASYFVQD